ncbi:hypothetical protein CHH58_06655 [Terribacillus saccharophilus]|uniref:hypothetical protein n=1 Tax=Terribacillus saccharophilus TaxID=361277 RepID=UPI000BA66839|nr:hypothetical protein [Terribacillus saccharophilus]PAF37865.1 hypothetical protein CHH58_06655 [Terribacillus saccharophilus]
MQEMKDLLSNISQIIPYLPVILIIVTLIPKVIRLISSTYRERIMLTHDALFLRETIFTLSASLVFAFSIVNTIFDPDFSKFTTEGTWVYLLVNLLFTLLIWFVAALYYRLIIKLQEDKMYYKLHLNGEDWYVIKAINKNELLLYDRPIRYETEGLRTFIVPKSVLEDKILELHIEKKKRKVKKQNNS